jgi:SsrA-binding protein
MNDIKYKVISQNKKARHNYFIEDCYEAGIVLFGTEVKSIRLGKVNLKDSYAVVRNNEVFLCNMHISPYEQGNIFNKDPVRDRKLLLKKSEIHKLLGFIMKDGLTLVPTQLYLKRGKVKVEIAIGRGKKLYDKREDIAKKESQRNIERHLKNRF